jgi:hypothetical protein
VAAFLRADLVLDHHAGGAGTGVFDHRALDVERIAVAGIAVADQRHPAGGGAAVAHAVEHLSKGYEAGVRQAEPRRRHRKAAHEGDLEAGLGHEFRRQRVVTTGHDPDAGFGQQFAQAPGGSDGRHFGGSMPAALIAAAKDA